MNSTTRKLFFLKFSWIYPANQVNNQYKFVKNNAEETANKRNFFNIFEFLLVRQLTNDNTIARNGKKTCKLESVMPRKFGMYEVSFMSPNTMAITSTPCNINDNKIETRAALSIFDLSKFVLYFHYNLLKFKNQFNNLWLFLETY